MNSVITGNNHGLTITGTIYANSKLLSQIDTGDSDALTTSHVWALANVYFRKHSYQTSTKSTTLSASDARHVLIVLLYIRICQGEKR